MYRILFIIVSLIPLTLQGAPFYTEYWQRALIGIWEKQCLSVDIYTEVKTGNHFSSIRSFQVSGQLAYEVNKMLDLEVHYAYISGRSVVPHSSWNWQQRVEFEVNPTLFVSKNVEVLTRNRLEIRRFQDVDFLKYRFRQRTALNFPLKNRAPLKSWGINNELFYDITKNLISQNRFCPLILSFDLTKKTSLDLFFIYRHLLTNEVWCNEFVLGTQIYF